MFNIQGILFRTLPYPHYHRFSPNLDGHEHLLQKCPRNEDTQFIDIFCSELFRKAEDLDLQNDTTAVSLNAFISVERDNAVTVEKIKALQSYISQNPRSNIAKDVDRVKVQISKILGTLPRLLDPTFTSGATQDLTGVTNPLVKLKSSSVTSQCLSYLRKEKIVREDYTSCFWPKNQNPPSIYGAAEDNFTIVDGCRITTVPKTAETDRVIAKEPVVNLAYQGNLGSLIRSALNDFGLDLRTAQFKHRELAKQGSLTGLLATIDLKNASDRITWNLCELLLPSDWFEAIMALRSPIAEFDDGKTRQLEMVSTAGNGFTFELESLLFFAIALSSSGCIYNSCPPDISVYGDDIITPTCFYDQTVKLLTVLGAVVNETKSFKQGPFRESCGGDFLNGVNVRGYNAKKLYPQTPREIYSFINGVFRVCYLNNGNSWRSDWCCDLWKQLLYNLARETGTKTCFGPSHYGDAVITLPFDGFEGFNYVLRKRNKWSDYDIKTLQPYTRDLQSFGTLSQGLSGHILCRAVSLPHLTDSGLVNKIDLIQADTENEVRYPEFFHVNVGSIVYRPRWIPFTLHGSAPEDISELFKHISPNSDPYFNMVRKASERIVQKREQITKLLRVLSQVSGAKRSIQKAAIASFDAY